MSTLAVVALTLIASVVYTVVIVTVFLTLRRDR